MRPRLLDLFGGAGGAGGAAMGYHRAGFEVVGIDIEPQPHYPFEAHQADALEVLAMLVAGESWQGYVLDDFAAVHASPPCEHYSRITGINGAHSDHPDLIPPTRAVLSLIAQPWVMENVADAPMRNYFRLCGSSFGLDVRRHRLFEVGGWSPLFLPPCAHHWQRPRFRSLNKHGRLEGKLSPVVGVYGSTNYRGELRVRSEAMGIDWMTNAELVKAIPPAYTEWIGAQLVAHLEAAAA